MAGERILKSQALSIRNDHLSGVEALLSKDCVTTQSLVPAFLHKILGTSHEIGLIRSLIQTPFDHLNIEVGIGGSEGSKRVFLPRYFREHHENMEICVCPNLFCPALWY